MPESHATTEREVDLGPGAGAYILFLKYWLPARFSCWLSWFASSASALLFAAIAILLLPVAWLTRRVAFALRSMRAVVTAQQLELTLPTWGGWLGPSTPLVNLQVPRHDIEAVEVAPDPAGFGLARKADLIMKNGGRVPIWRHGEGMRKQWVWRPGEGLREHTAATYAQTSPGGISVQFRLMGALLGFAERLAAALDVPFRNRVVSRHEGPTS